MVQRPKDCSDGVSPFPRENTNPVGGRRGQAVATVANTCITYVKRAHLVLALTALPVSGVEAKFESHI